MIVDAHTHIWPRWPYDPPVPDSTSRGSFENLLFQLDQNGVDEALVVNAHIEGAHDNNDYGALAVAGHPDRLHHIVDIDSRWSAEYHSPGAADRLRALIDRYRPAGVSHYLAPDNDGWLVSDQGIEFFALAASRGLVVSFAAPPAWLDDLRVIARRFPELPLLVNHLAVVMLHPAGIDEALRLVLDEEDLPNLLVKVSGYYYGNERPWDYPYTDRLGIVKAFYETWGPRRMVWASDWPSLLPHQSYRQALQLLPDHLEFLAPGELDLILGDTLHAVLADRARART